MPPTALKQKGKRSVGNPPRAPAQLCKRLTQAAFFLTLVLVIARAAMQETFRGDALPAPGAPAAPATPGPATSLLLDLLCCLPALFVLARRLVDPDFSLRPAWSHLLMFALAAWTLASVLWSSDKFAAGMAGFHWAAAIVLLWSTSQLVRSWVRLRLVAAAAFGVLLVLLVQGYYYRFVDLPGFQRDFREHKQERLAERGIAPDSVKATQLEKNIESGEVTGFSLSRNTYAAVLVMLVLASGGIALQRVKDRDHAGWWVPIVLTCAAGLMMLYFWVQSKTAFATPVVGAVLLGALARKRDWIATHARRIYWSGVLLFILAAAAVVGHGLKHGTLFHVSLTFRWQYWVGAAKVFAHHAWLGVGWANFRPYYLMYRLPQAAEEPNDPHNFLVRAFVELGLLGGVLVVAWVLRIWWELTVAGPRASVQTAAPVAARYRPVPLIVSIAVGATALNAMLAIDWAQSDSWIFLEIFKRLLFVLALIGGMGLVAIRSWQRQELDDRPADWLLAGLLIALGLFLLHNLIDFSMFEPGPMFLFALLIGAALGMRTPAPHPLSIRRGLALAAFMIAGVAWIVTVGAVLVPVVQAEAKAQDADGQIRASKTADGGSESAVDVAKLDHAKNELIEAFRLTPINADYAFRAAQAATLSGADSSLVRQLLNQAIETDPMNDRYRIARAQLEAHTGDLPHALADYDQALQLDPCNLELRIEYADVLREIHRPADARRQYQKALDLNDQLARDEIRRLPERRVREIQELIDTPTRQ